MITLSIVIPIFNAEDYLVECLNSIVAQWHKNVEIICINDGSTDNSLEILKSYIDNLDTEIAKKIIVIDQLNMGVSNTRNIGLKKYSGEYLGFIDPDDVILPNYFNRLFEEIEKCKPDIIEFKYKDSNNNVFSVSDNTGDLWSTFKTGRWYLWSRIYKRELIEGHYFIPNIIFEDMAFLPQIYIKARNIQYIDDCLYLYRINPDSLTRVVSKKSIDLNMFSLKSLFDLFESKSKDHDYYLYMAFNSRYLFAIYGVRFLGLRKGFSEFSKLHFELKRMANINIYLNFNKILFFRFSLIYLILYKSYLFFKKMRGFLK